MQPVVTDRPYEFVPPHHGNVWPWLLRFVLPGRLRNTFGITGVEIRDSERLDSLLRDGHSVLLAPNHCRMADPLVMGMLSRHVRHHFFIMASSHLFYQGRLLAWLVRRAGGFSVYREGVDRDAVKAAVDILTVGRRPLVIFPEGSLSHSNDRLNALMAGVPFIARAAAKRRAKLDSKKKRVVVLPTAIKYLFKGDLSSEVEPILAEIEARLSWRKQRGLSLLDRVYRLGGSLLTLKELEFFGEPGSGDLTGRLQRLINHLLHPLEEQWVGGRTEGSVITRVKELRKAVLPAMIEGSLSEDEWQERSDHLADMYLAQQLSLYPPKYIASKPTVDRLLETVDKFLENLTGEERPHPPITAVVQLGEPVAVDPQTRRGQDGDSLLAAIEGQLSKMLSELAGESRLHEESAPGG